jgi:hypothetical protein
MKLLASLDPKDRRMVFVTLGLVAALFAILAIFTPGEDPGKNPTPDSYLTGKHGAKAAFLFLNQSGYRVERWEQPLSDLAERADAGTVLILAAPFSAERDDRGAVRLILEKGGRVLATGVEGGLLLPGNAVTPARGISFADCEAQPEGLEPLAASGTIWIAPQAGWRMSGPQYRSAYDCGGRPVVVEYAFSKGHAVWWAGSTPLENASITRDANLELLLNSVGPAAGHTVYWDESLHGNVHTPWDYTRGPVWPLLLFGSIALAVLVVLSFSRRSGPIRGLPAPPRTTPIEFLDALGSLYRSAGAANTAVQIAWDRFRSQAVRLCGQRNTKVEAAELAAAIQRRFGSSIGASLGTEKSGIEADLIAAEQACSQDDLKPNKALEIVQSLRRHEETLRAASSARLGSLGKAS